MTKITDSFVVAIGLDPTNYNKGRKQVREDFQKTKNEAQSTGAALEEDGKRGARFFSAIRNEAILTVGALVGANSLRQFVARSISDLSTMDRVARQTGTTVQGLDTFVSAIVRNGGDVNTATTAFSNLANAMEELRITGNSPILPFLNRIGGGRNDSPEQLLEKLGAYQDQYGDKQRTAFYGRQLGFDEASIDLALRGKDAVHAAMVESRRLGVATDEQAKKARDAQNAWRELIQTLSNGGRGIVTDLIPGLTGVTSTLANIAAQAPKTAAAITVLLGAALGAGGIRGLGVLWRLLFGGGGASVAGEVAAGGASVAGEVAAGGAGAAAGTAIGVGGAALGAGIVAGGAILAYGGGMSADEDKNLVAHRAYSYFRAKGYSDAQARGIAAGIFAEGGTADAVNPTSGAFGVGQWLGSRRRGLTERYGANPNLMQQFDYLDYELRGGDHGGAAVRGQTTEQGTLDAYIRNFMRPAPGKETTGDLQRGGAWLSANRSATAETPISHGVFIDRMTINTQATDARGISRDIHNALVTQANSGLGG